MRRRPRVATVTAATILALSTAYTVIAIAAPGSRAATVQLTDGSVWVTRAQFGDIARLNRQIDQLDAQVIPSVQQFTVLQSGYSVYSYSPTDGQIRQLETAAVSLGVPLGVPRFSTVSLGNQTMAIASHGDAWVLPAADLTSFDPKAPALTGLGTNPASYSVVVGWDGVAHAYSLGEQKMIDASLSADGTLSTRYENVAVATGAQAIALSAVGSTPVVLDETDGAVVVPGHPPVEIPGTPADLQIQQPGPQNGVVYVASDRGLYAVPLTGGPATLVPHSAAVSGAPIAPVFDDGCVNAAWPKSETYAYSCGASGATLWNITGLPANAQLVFRVNRTVVALNDSYGGDVWVTQKGLVQVAHWNQFEKAVNPAFNYKNTTGPASGLQSFAQRNKRPVARNVELGARPGRTTVLPVLDFDSDPNGDVLSLVSPTSLPAAEGTLQIADNGTVFQFTPAPGATGRVQFPYTITDGAGGNDVSKPATVTVTIVPDSVETPPRALSIPAYHVAAGRTIEFNALSDWYDFEGDPFELLAVRSPAHDTVTFSSNGQVAFVATGASGPRTLQLLVRDDLGHVGKGAVIVDVGASGQLLAPQTSPLLAEAVAGVPTTLEPLSVDTDPNDDPLQLASVTESTATRGTPGVDVAPNYDSGGIQFLAQRPGTYYLQYVATDVPPAGAGRSSRPTSVRVDVMAPAAAGPPVAEREIAYLAPGGTTTVPVLDDASDPSGAVLVVQSVQVPPGSPVQASVFANRAVRLTTNGLLGGPQLLTYTISDGRSEASAEIDVLPATPPVITLPPVAEPVTAIVRAGDVGTIDPLATDFDPQGGTLSLVPGSVSVDGALSRFPGKSDGYAFVDNGSVRYEAPPVPGQAVVSYSVTDASRQTATSTITVTVAPDGTVNEPPAPAPIEASVIAGSAVTLAVPMAGVDPSGESVTLIGPATGPALGSVQVTADTMAYQAFPSSAGTDTFEYALRDKSGLVGDGVVRVGVSPAGPLDAPPVAVPQTIRVQPGHTVGVAVLAGDYDPQGYRISFASKDLSLHGTNAAISGDDIVAHAPPAHPGTATIDYAITDGYGPPVPGVLTVVTDPSRNFSVPPVANDIVVPYLTKPGASSVQVNVLAAVSDPDGTHSDLQIVGFPGAPAPHPRVLAGGMVSIRLTGATQVLVYKVHGADGFASATITVPARGADEPALRKGENGFTTPENKPYTVSIGTFVFDPAGRPLRLVSRQDVTAAEGSVIVLGPTSFRFVPDHDYAGPASVTFQATDGAPGSAGAAQATISLAVSVVGNVPPSFRGPTIVAELGKRTTVGLLNYVVDPNPAANGIHFSPPISPPPSLGASIRGDTLSLLPQGAISGTSQAVQFKLSDGLGPQAIGEVLVVVVSTTKPLALAPPQSATVDQGKSVTVPVLQSDVDPFGAAAPLLVLSAHVVSGSGTATTDGSTVKFTAGATFSGTATVVYTLEDETHLAAREVEGTISVTVYGRPGTPGAPQVVASSSETVLLAWTAPPDNGQPITSYVVTYGSSSDPCGPTTTCTVHGLRNGSHYRFAVYAVNSVDRGPSSGLSALVTPDVVPPAPSTPTASFVPNGNAIALGWTGPGSGFVGTKVTAYEIEVSPATGSSPTATVTTISYKWRGLTNGVSYTFTVRAQNQKGWSAWSPASAPQVPASDPSRPEAPAAQAVPNDPTGGKVDVQWPAVNGAADNGAPVGDYTLYIYEATRLVGTQKVVPTSETENPVTVTLSGLSNSATYNFTVTATNKAGTSRPSPASSEFTVYGQPGAITDLSAAKYQNRQTTLTFTPPSSNGRAISGYNYSQDGGAWQTLTQSNGQWVVSGLTNGTTYTFNVEACNTYCGAPSNQASAEPDGNPTPPPVSGSVTNTTFTFQWGTGTADGCPISKYGYSVSSQGGGQNGPWTSTSGPGSVQVQGNYNETITVWVWVQDSCGNSSPTASSGSATSGPPPPPPQSVTITGPVGPAVTCTQTGGKCYWVGISGTGFPANTTVNYSCADSGGTFWTYHVTTDGSGNVRLPQGSGTNENGCQYGQTGGVITATVDGVQSKPYTWPPGY